MRVFPEVIQDEEFKTLRTAGYTGSLNDMQHAYLVANTALTGGALADLFAAERGLVAPDGTNLLDPAEWTGLGSSSAVDPSADDFIVSDISAGALVRITGANANLYTWEGATVKLTTDYSLADATTVALSWGAVEEEAGEWWDPSNPTRLTVPSGVDRVRIYAHGRKKLATAGQLVVNIRKNGSSYTRMPGADADAEYDAVSIASRPIAVTPGDYFEMMIFQSGFGIAVDIASDETYFAIEAVRGS